MANESEIWIVVAEVGSDWAVWADRFRLSTPDVVIVFQQRGESGIDFARRVRDRAQRLQESGRTIQRAVFVPSSKKGQIGPRSMLVRALSAAVESDGHLLLSAPAAEPHTMVALASTVQQVQGSGASIQVARPSWVPAVA